jgi:hypothetical protein
MQIEVGSGRLEGAVSPHMQYTAVGLEKANEFEGFKL